VTLRPEFALLPLARLRNHEKIVPEKVRELVAEITRSQLQSDPIWVDRASWVILNGHHRAEALRRLGAKRVAAWVFDYESDAIEVGRWRPGPPITKAEVVRRALEGRPFPAKTTRHRLTIDLPPREVPLRELHA
jgi:L-serine kinase (ADP)